MSEVAGEDDAVDPVDFRALPGHDTPVRTENDRGCAEEARRDCDCLGPRRECRFISKKGCDDSEDYDCD